MWVLLGPGDAAHRAVAVVPDPHLGTAVRRRRRARGPMTTGERRGHFFEHIQEAFEHSWPKPAGDRAARSRTTPPPRASTSTSSSRLVDFARENDVIVVHDNAYAELGFDGWEPPSILQAEGAKECAVELYSMTKSFSMAGWRMAFLVGNRRGRAGARQAQELPRLRHVPADPDRRHRHAERGRGLPAGGAADLPGVAATRSATASTASAGRSSRPRGRCSPGRRSRSPTARWGRSSSLDAREGGARRHLAGRRASAPTATASCASRSSRTSSASTRPCATSRRPSRSWAERPTARRRRSPIRRGGQPAAATRRGGAEVSAAPRTPSRQKATPASTPASSRSRRATRGGAPRRPWRGRAGPGRRRGCGPARSPP